MSGYPPSTCLRWQLRPSCCCFRWPARSVLVLLLVIVTTALRHSQFGLPSPEEIESAARSLSLSPRTTYNLQMTTKIWDRDVSAHQQFEHSSSYVQYCCIVFPSKCSIFYQRNTNSNYHNISMWNPSQFYVLKYTFCSSTIAYRFAKNLITSISFSIFLIFNF